MFRRVRSRLPELGRWTRRAIAGACLLLAALSAVDARTARSASGASDRPVVVAAHALPAGHLLTGRDLVVHLLPSAAVPAGIRAGPDSVAGRRLAGPVTAGEPITSARLLGRGLLAGLAAGTVALPVTVSDGHTADLVGAGDRIDLVTTARSPDAAGIAPAGPAGGQLVATRLLVLAVQRDTESGTSSTALVVATDRGTALRITRAGASQDFAALGVSP